VAKALAAVYRDEDEARTSTLPNALSVVGIQAAYSSSETASRLHVKIENDENEGLPAGYTRADYSAEKLAEFDAEALRKSKHNVWNFIRIRQQNGSLELEQANALLDDLALDARPCEVTTVSGTLALREYDGYGNRRTKYFAFSMPGHQDKDEVKPLIEATLIDLVDQVDVALRQAFPEAEGIEDPFRRIDVTYATVWPVKSGYEK
jgi:hypothetical protein